jgi:hypothetical protein
VYLLERVNSFALNPQLSWSLCLILSFLTICLGFINQRLHWCVYIYTNRKVNYPTVVGICCFLVYILLLFILKIVYMEVLICAFALCVLHLFDAITSIYLLLHWLFEILNVKTLFYAFLIGYVLPILFPFDT